MPSAKVFSIALLLALLPQSYSASILSQRLQHPCGKICHVDEVGYALTKNFEGFSPFAYPDVGGKMTIAFGHLIRPGEHFKQPLVGADAQALLERDMQAKERALHRMVKIELRQEQFDSLADFTFNVGEASLQKSTLLKRVNASREKDAYAEFLKWDHVGGKVSSGLHRRRSAEAALFTMQ